MRGIFSFHVRCHSADVTSAMSPIEVWTMFGNNGNGIRKDRISLQDTHRNDGSRLRVNRTGMPSGQGEST